jgi:nitroimidazol reductase NimA-like FMN-containing flavoprotein (pyridoxamine 5'-phosphate oxidase superfamily)
VPVCYVYHDGGVYGHTIEGMKWQAMRSNPDVCFEVERVDDLTTWRSVIAWGRFEELTGADAEQGMHLLVDRLLPLLRPDGADSPPTHGGTLHAAVYRIRLDEKTGRFENPQL